MIVLLGVIALVFLAVGGYIAFFYFSYKDDTVRSGDAYGFSIGDTHQEVFDKAVQLKTNGKIEAIHRWPEGSSHFEFSEAELSEAMQDDRWTMVVNSNWWNNSIYLEFEEGRLSEIRRFRMWGELP